MLSLRPRSLSAALATLAFISTAPAQTSAPAPVRLTLNENPYGPSPLVVKALQADLGGLFRYVGDEAATLTAQIAAFEGVAPEQVVLGDILDPLGVHLSLQGGSGGEFTYTVPPARSTRLPRFWSLCGSPRSRRS